MKKRLFTLLLAGALLTVNGGYGSIQEVKAASDPIQIATKPMTEQYILGEMLRLIIEDKTDYEAEITKGIGGGTSNIQPAMEKGEFDLYPEYTSSGWVMVLGHEADEVDDEEMFEKLKEEYEENYDMTWVRTYLPGSWRLRFQRLPLPGLWRALFFPLR